MTSLLALIAAAALAQDGSFPQPAGWGEMRVPERYSAPAGVGSGTTDETAAPSKPAYVAPTSVSQRSVTNTQQPAKKDEKEDERGGQPQMPQVPGGGGGEQGGDKKGGGSGGGCQGKSEKLGESTANLERKLAEANPSDEATKKLIDRARQTVAQGKDAKGKLDNASETLGQVKTDLEQANKMVSSQNDRNQGDIQKLDAAQKGRDSAIKAAQSSPPSCSPPPAASYGQGSASQAQQAESGVSSGRSGRRAADGLISAASYIPGSIGAAAALFQGAGTAAGAAMGTGDLGGAATQISLVAQDARNYVNAARGASEAADQAIGKVDTARKESASTAEKIGQANTKAKEADSQVKQLCQQIQELKPKWDAAKPADRPAIEAQAAQLKTQMQTKSDAVKPEIEKARSQHQTAQMAYQDAVSAVNALGIHLVGK